MSRYYPDWFKDQLKEKANISQVIGQFVQLAPIGSNLFGLCPFHDDHNPSMQVKPETGTFYCHSCGAGSKGHSHVQSSDVYGFLKGILGGNMSDAIEWLAQFLGEPLPVMDAEEQKKSMLRGKWIEFCEAASQRFTNNLLNNKEAISYLYHRGFTMQDILNWKLGFGDKVDYDFRNTDGRLVFSLFDYNGNIISFTGRVLMPDHVLKETNEKLALEGKPKILKYLDRYPVKKDDPYYQNHPYPEFDKRNHLYGIHVAKDYIRQWGTVVLVEGWTDVIKLHKFGVKHAVGTMGVALTETQVLMIKRSGAKKAYILRDGDMAGYNAALRDGAILEKHGILPMIVPMLEGEDPCEMCDRYIGQNEKLAEDLNKNAMTLPQYKIMRVLDETTDQIHYHQRQLAFLQNDRMKRVIKVLSSITDPVEQDIYIRQVSELFNISYAAIQQHVMHYSENKTFMVQ
jgi:DNA primase